MQKGRYKKEFITERVAKKEYIAEGSLQKRSYYREGRLEGSSCKRVAIRMNLLQRESLFFSVAQINNTNQNYIINLKRPSIKSEVRPCLDLTGMVPSPHSIFVLS